MSQDDRILSFSYVCFVYKLNVNMSVKEILFV